MPEKESHLSSPSSQKEITLGSSIRSFAESLSALRDFVHVVSSFLDEHRRKLLSANRAGLTPLLLAINRIVKDPKISVEEAEGIEKELGDRIKNNNPRRRRCPN
jgi:hypothetical protein